ncbi:phage portal protein [Comamonas thiooxydans]|uniref:phage portal protein n=1 Tax=Comamonas thiooxydans TaxID=363952 RepID=UPI00244ABE75|nr:phage portal protein [Comamonas thiooxydans]MDH1472939.1 phage portal protein [Comamonas thiooxydans]
MQKKPLSRKASPTAFDRLVGYFSPLQGLRRQAAREMLVRAYEGADRKDGWFVKRTGASARADHQADARELRVRARSLVQNVPNITRAVAAVLACRVGQGIVPVWTDPGLAKRWKEWVPLADYDGLLNFYGLEAKIERTRDVDGAVIIRKHIQKMGSVVPLRLQVLEIDYLDEQRSGVLSGGAEIISGIEYDKRGRRVAYYLFDRHPGDVGNWTVGRSGSSKRVPADEVIHYFNPERPGQQDGITRLAPIIAKVRDLHTYGDSELQRKQLESRMGVLAEMDGSSQLPKLPDEQGKEGEPGLVDLGDLAGGAIVGLPPGMTNPTFIEPKPVPGYEAYMKFGWKEVAAGYGCPYELMTGDLTEVNFSSSRVRMNQFRAEVESEQWTITVPRMCEPIAAWWLSACELVTALPVNVEPPDWSTPKWASPNPVQDVVSDMTAIKGGLQSLSETIRRRGYDPEQVREELAADLKWLQDEGILPLLAALWGAKDPLELAAQVGSKEPS